MFAFFLAFLLGSATFASPTAQQESLPLRVVFLGGEWSAGSWAKPEETVGARFAVYLEKYLHQKVELRTVPVGDLSQLSTLVQSTLAQKGADYVFYYCDHSATLVEYAARAYAPWTSDSDRFVDYLGRQIGAIRLGSKINGSAYPENILLDPLGERLRQAGQVATYYGAKFILLWPAFSIGAISWEPSIPDQWPYKALKSLDVFKSKPRISSERLNYYLRTKDIPHIANLQISNYFAAIREEDRSNTTFRAPATSDKVADMLATSVVSQEF